MKRTFTHRAVAVILGMAFLLAGCGKGTEKTSGSESGDTEAGQGNLLSEMLGGTELTYHSELDIGSKHATMDLKTLVVGSRKDADSLTAEQMAEYGTVIVDTDTLPSYRVREVKEDTDKEAEIVKTLLGDDVKEVRRTVSVDNGDARGAVECCSDAYSLYVLSGRANDMLMYPKDYPAWVDDRDYTLHTYEGKHNDIDSQLVVSYRKDTKMLVINLSPKKWSDVSGNPQYTEMNQADGGQLMLPDENDAQSYSMKDLSECFPDLTNQAGSDTDQIRSEVWDYVSETLKLKMPRETVVDSGDMGRALSQLVFCPEGELTKKDPKNVLIDGYLVQLQTGLGQQSFYEENPGENMVQANSGTVSVTDRGVVACDIHYAYEFEERLTDRVELLTFEKAMDALKTGLSEQLESERADGEDITVSRPVLCYYPVASADKKGEYTYIPVWCAMIYSGDTDFIGEAIQNAMDGTLIRIAYYEE